MLYSWYEAYKLWPNKTDATNAATFYADVEKFLESEGLNYQYVSIYPIIKIKASNLILIIGRNPAHLLLNAIYNLTLSWRLDFPTLSLVQDWMRGGATPKL